VVTPVGTFYGVIEQAKDAVFNAAKAMQKAGNALPPDLGQEEPEQQVDLSSYCGPRLVVIRLEFELRRR